MASVFALAAVIVFASCSAWADSTWTGSAGDRKWSTAGNWTPESVPSADAVVNLPNGAEVQVDDDSVSLLSRVSIVKTPAGSHSRVVVTLSNDASINCKIDTRVTLVKNGSAALSLLDDTQLGYSGGLELAAGTIIYPQASSGRYQIGPTTIAKDAKLVMRNGSNCTVYFETIDSEGLITNETANVATINVSGSTHSKPAVISGLIRGKMSIGNYAPLYITGTNNTISWSVAPYTPYIASSPCVLGLAKIGRIGEASSSIGTVSKLLRSYNGVIYRYLGEGETTDKTYTYGSAGNEPDPYWPDVWDAGAVGGVTFTGEWKTTAQWQLPLVLTGSNSVPCVLANAMTPAAAQDGVNFTTHITKKGTGTWRFNDHASRNITGAMTVEEGTVQFESIAEAGVRCSLGFSTELFESYYGAYDLSRTVDWAFALGTAGTEGTMEHVGSGPATCSTRPFRLFGDGRIKASGGLLSLSGFSAQAGTSPVLTLDGTNAAENVAADVADGDGTLSLTKEGPGTWRLASGTAISGDLSVKEGTLVVDGPGVPYRFFRFTSYETMGAQGQSNYCYQTTFDELSLFSADGTRRNLNLVWDVESHDAANYYETTVDVPSLLPGHACYAFGAKWWYYANNAYGMTKLWDEQKSGEPFVAWQSEVNSAAKAPVYEHPERRVSVAMCLPDDCPEIVRYDFCSSSMSANNATVQLPKVFELEGSVDGRTWYSLHFKDDQAPLSGTGRWASDDSPFDTQYTNVGFAVCGHTSFPPQLSGVRSVSVATNATLRANGTVAAISKLVVPAGGLGTIEGFSLAEAGVVDIPECMVQNGEFTVPVRFVDCTGLGMAEGWSVTFDGVPKNSRFIRFSENGIVVAKKGFVIIVD